MVLAIALKNKGNNMKCPNCGYIHGWQPETLSSVDGEKGSFYTFRTSPTEVNLLAERNGRYEEGGRRDVYGCPSCMMVFMS